LIGLDKKLNINGYYTINDTLNSGTIIYGYTNMIFFDDGMFVSGFHKCCDTSKQNIGKVIPSYIDTIVDQRKLGDRIYTFYEGFIWGYYNLSGDTIKVQHISRPALGDMNRFWYAYEIWFKIINKNSIEEIYRYPIHHMTDSDKSNFEINKKKWTAVKAYFRPLDKLPESDGWLKYEDWFWKDNDKYNDWIQKTN
jgi:hypothetical protein